MTLFVIGTETLAIYVPKLNKLVAWDRIVLLVGLMEEWGSYRRNTHRKSLPQNVQLKKKARNCAAAFTRETAETIDLEIPTCFRVSEVVAFAISIKSYS